MTDHNTKEMLDNEPEENAIRAPLYSADVINNVKSRFPNLIEDSHNKINEMTEARENLIEAVRKSEDHSESFKKENIRILQSEQNEKIEEERKSHRIDVNNRIGNLEYEIDRVTYADDKEELSQRLLVKNAREEIHTSVSVAQKVDRQIALESNIYLRKMSQSIEETDISKSIRLYPQEALKVYEKALSETNTRMINFFEKAWVSINNKKYLADMEDHFEAEFTRLKDARIATLSEKLTPLNIDLSILTMYRKEILRMGGFSG